MLVASSWNTVTAFLPRPIRRLVHKGGQALGPGRRNGQDVAALEGQSAETVECQPSPAGHAIAFAADPQQLISPVGKPYERALRGIVQKLRRVLKEDGGGLATRGVGCAPHH